MEINNNNNNSNNEGSTKLPGAVMGGSNGHLNSGIYGICYSFFHLFVEPLFPFLLLSTFAGSSFNNVACVPARGDCLTTTTTNP